VALAAASVEDSRVRNVVRRGAMGEAVLRALIGALSLVLVFLGVLSRA
jgi:hypothetical protein